MNRTGTVLALLTLATVQTADAQALKSAPSTRATTEVTLNPPRVQGQPAPKALTIKIDYGQPHARGRDVSAGVLAADLGKVWRLGANSSTTMTTDVDMMIGNLSVPKGAYSLYAMTSARGNWQLIVNKNTGQWGTEHKPDMDLGRVELKARTLATPVDAFVMVLAPGADGAPNGELRFMWGGKEFTTTWAAK